MGDTGTLPATGTVSNKVPEMGATEPMTNTGSHTMGDTGTLPGNEVHGRRGSATAGTAQVSALLSASVTTTRPTACSRVA